MIWLYAWMTKRLTVASHPPASTTSARPARIQSTAAAMACAPVAQAALTVVEGPWAPSQMLSWAAAALVMCLTT